MAQDRSLPATEHRGHKLAHPADLRPSDRIHVGLDEVQSAVSHAYRIAARFKPSSMSCCRLITFRWRLATANTSENDGWTLRAPIATQSVHSSRIRPG